MGRMKQLGTEAGALAAIRFACTNLEQVMAHIILTTSISNRPAVMGCLMEKLKVFMEEAKGCKPKDDPGPTPGQGPDCDPGWRPVNNYCVPLDDESGGNA